ncbi:type I polyketide synthase [Goodfellowiella coeruleoviolacea]|uniref:Acyl transferase domain-containing protein n=1 Tax=Goodfellowiella coeruleoviolacea TaxID=334858 RepID=A0AAE3KID8_9PSEU|nr:type I polyketide synthase [Goodfellowiella coeruleoviolacea]MCP2163163.1 Acyl transferase domain-containing protein [Goodfellowiella coeruleoviolacea]
MALSDPCSPDSAGRGAAGGIAVVGMACRLPGAADPAELWNLLSRGGDAVRDAPPHRGWPAGAPTSRGGFLDRIDLFDAEFFGMLPVEAAATDPQQRLALELVWEALEDAGVVPASLRGQPVGVFAGVAADGYAHLLRESPARSSYAAAGVSRSMIANRVSHVLATRGPSITVDTGQSSSLVAVHLAAESLLRGESSMAVVVGVHLNTDPAAGRHLGALGVLSPSGRCAVFDADADGFVRGEGGGVVVLKPLAEAIRAGDPVHAVILGSAVNHDGGSDTLTAPNPDAQRDVRLLACHRAGVGPEDVQYVELHGTGTRLGDAVEATALGAGAAEPRAEGAPLLVGSVKTNIGHLEGAAGIAGLLKLILALVHRQLPASLHFRAEGPPLARLGLRVPTARGPWPRPDRPLLGGVSSFGLGGTNCHVVVGEAPARAGGTAAGRGTGPVAWPLSGRTETDLRAQAARLRGWLSTADGDPEDIAHSLATTRTHFAHRAVVVAADEAARNAALASVAAGAPSADALLGHAPSDRPGAPVFVLPGHGPQWTGMARGLLTTSAVFAERIQECDEAFAQHVDWSLREVLLGAPGAPALTRDDVVQPAMFATVVALAAVWASCGVRPAALIGHSQGEIAAAHLAGALSLPDAVRIVAARARTVATLAGTGAMLSTALPADELARMIAEQHHDLHVAVVNAPNATVASGDPRAVRELARACAAEGIAHQVLGINYASHSPHVEPLRARLRAELGDITPRPLARAVYSTVTGGRADAGFATAEYWGENLRRPVRFDAAVRAALAEGHRAFVEVSPHPVLAQAVADVAAHLDTPVAVVGTLHRDDGGWDRFVRSLAQAHAQGVDVSWDRVYPAGRRVRLPTYPFHRRSHWLPDTGAPAASTAEPADDGRARDPLDVVTGHLAVVLGNEPSTPVDPERSFRELGLDSVGISEFCGRLSAATGVSLTTAEVFSHPTPRALADHVAVLIADLATGEEPASHERPRADVLRALTHLERVLPGLSGDAAPDVDARLRALLRTLNELHHTAPDPLLGAASDDELFAVLDNELGLAGASGPNTSDLGGGIEAR